MRFIRTGITFFAAAIFAGSAIAQTPPAITRTVVAATKLPSVVETPLYFHAFEVSITQGQTSGLSAANGILYQIAGSTDVSLAGEMKTLAVGDGVFVAAGRPALLKAGGDAPSTLLYFLLTPAPEGTWPAVNPPATVKELYRTAFPIPDLQPGSYDLNLTRVTFPAQMPSNPPHYRSGAALYYILSGTGMNTIAGKTEGKDPGSLIYEPFGLVHQWGNAGETPFTFLAFNINPDGVAAVLQGEPANAK
jgi:quercetin dioxygenase-like cupin family protein